MVIFELGDFLEVILSIFLVECLVDVLNCCFGIDLQFSPKFERLVSEQALKVIQLLLYRQFGWKWMEVVWEGVLKLSVFLQWFLDGFL